MSELFIDPGFSKKGKGNAYSLFEGGHLTHTAFIRFDRSKARPCLGVRVSVVVVERPEYQGARTLAARVQDSMTLCWEGALTAAHFAVELHADLVEWAPSEWKGQEPKPMMHARLWEALTAREQELLGGEATRREIWKARERGALKRWPPGEHFYPEKFITHNLLDTVAMGCVYHGRIEKRVR